MNFHTFLIPNVYFDQIQYFFKVLKNNFQYRVRTFLCLLFAIIKTAIMKAAETLTTYSRRDNVLTQQGDLLQV